MYVSALGWVTYTSLGLPFALQWPIPFLGGNCTLVLKNTWRRKCSFLFSSVPHLSFSWHCCWNWKTNWIDTWAVTCCPVSQCPSLLFFFHLTENIPILSFSFLRRQYSGTGSWIGSVRIHQWGRFQPCSQKTYFLFFLGNFIRSIGVVYLTVLLPFFFRLIKAGLAVYLKRHSTNSSTRGMGHWQLSLCHHNGYLAASGCTCSASVQGTTLSRCHHCCQLGCASRMCYSQVLQTIAASLKGRGARWEGRAVCLVSIIFPVANGLPSLPLFGLTCMEFSFAWIVQVFFFCTAQMSVLLFKRVGGSVPSHAGPPH